VRVADVGGKKFDVAPGAFVAEIGDQRRHDIERALVNRDLGLLNRRRKLVVGSAQNDPPSLITHV
jgi:hypothetical protein